MIAARPSAAAFRDRLLTVMARRGMNQSSFARAAGLDRSTLAQLVSESGPRLPRAETLAAIATACGISTDWLLGLSQQQQADVPSQGEVMQIEPHEDVPIDDRMFQWMTEAAGAKIRTVPVSFPDLLKTPAVLRHEYRHAAGDAPPRSWDSVESRLAYLQQPDTEIEACACVQAIEELAHGRGIWTGLDLRHRVEQVERMAALCADLYPSFRLFLFDRRRCYSVPFTVFGSARAALFVGGIYFVFTWTEHIRALVRRFDVLVREAVVQPPDLPKFLMGLTPEPDR
jgi:transcriptional regulator with XRE-family HTH domain